jgi:tRNA(fMet)-specific endonuclease VapC
MRYLLDTNILSDLIRNPRGAVRRRLDSVRNDQVVTSIIVAGELRYGAAKKRSASLEGKVQHMLKSVAVMPFEHPADVLYGDLRAKLERTGRQIGNNDLLIAAHALATGCTLVTDNLREFARVESLVVENWLR